MSGLTERNWHPNWGRVLGPLSVGCTILLLCDVLMPEYNQDGLVRAMIFALLALSVGIIWGQLGILSLGHSAFFGVGAYATAIGATHWGTGVRELLATILIGFVVAMLVGAGIGWFVFYSRTTLPEMYVVLVTLALSVAFGQLVLSGGSFTGSSQGLSGFNSVWWSSTTWLWAVGSVLIVTTIAALILVTGGLGSVLRAIQQDERRCRYLGYNTRGVRLVSFAVSAGLAALAGSLYAAHTSVVAPSLVGFVLATEVIVWVAIGGRSTIAGPILGAVTINLLAADLNARWPFQWQLLMGVLFVAVVVFLPEGVVPAIARPAVAWLRGRRRNRAPRALVVDGSPAVQSAEMTSQVAVRLDAVKKAFGPLSVLRDVSMTAHRGQILSIVGPNGAGKSTLVDCITDGAFRDEGRIEFVRQEVRGAAPHLLARAGVVRTFQTPASLGSLTVSEALAVARWGGRLPTPWTRPRDVTFRENVATIVESSGLSGHLQARVQDLSHGLRQSLELAMVLALDPNILLLDEPTAGLSEAERETVGDLLIDLARGSGLCIALIEHDFDFVRRVSDRMLVLHEGRVLLEGTVSDIERSEVVRFAYLGVAVQEVDR